MNNCEGEVAGNNLFEKWAHQSRYYIDRAMSLPQLPSGAFCWNYSCKEVATAPLCPIHDACGQMEGILPRKERERRISVHGDIKSWLDESGKVESI